ncbi:MAG: methyltransferase domain-containing protein [Pelolinea sp.]|nr:methyltransferase domain-containing protein [Pelolinea sp.]
MNPTSHTQYSHAVRNNYDRLSRIYDLISGGTERNLIRETISTLNIAGTGNYLDIGCGTGTGLVELAKKYPSAKNVVGIDISMGMCKKAVQKITKQKLRPPLFSVCQANGFSLPFRSAKFDLVFMSFTFELIPDDLFQLLCSEVLRVLKLSGVYLTLNINVSKSRNPIFALYKWGHDNYPRLIDCRPVDSCMILKTFGFEIISTQTFNLWGIPVASVSASKDKK